MSCKRYWQRFVRKICRNWSLCIAFLFFAFLTALRFALYTPPKNVIYHSDDSDYIDVPRHHIPHHQQGKGPYFDDEEVENPRKIIPSTPKAVSRKRPPPRRVLVSSGFLIEQDVTTRHFEINGMDWRIALWEYFHHFEKNNTKLILFWTPWFGDDQWKFHLRRNDETPVIRLGEHQDESGNWDDPRSCYMGFDKDRIKDATAVVFHARGFDGPSDLPDYRRGEQYWIYYELETPIESRFGGGNGESWKQQVNKISFNWTWTYTRQADIHQPFGHFVKKASANDTFAIEKKIRKNLLNFEKREFDAVFVISKTDCKTQSAREVLVKKLQDNGLNVDVLGLRCNQGLSPEIMEQRLGTVGMWSRYRFYFAFETAKCDDYVSHKVYRAYNLSRSYDIIPVVYGAGKTYDKLLPKNSYIDAESFASIRDLADFLKKLASSPVDKLAEYFEWQKTYDLNLRAHKSGLRTLCERIWLETGDLGMTTPDNNNKPSVVKDVASVFGKCYNASAEWLGIETAKKATPAETEQTAATEEPKDKAQQETKFKYRRRRML